ncbi:hypothetical protein [Paludibaculum fermentans]|uniref:Uncharacterized protein n=1 Tax=Paludibaculum fermentans TaxID=1473598 RepID=A0A7S7NV61_PALFE|nr:hypothetical protein [Paludibaculum fermentans]QOY90391.1 hypothetical protein IRI77_10675 [Paludibaculum fermentans]
MIGNDPFSPLSSLQDWLLVDYLARLAANAVDAQDPRPILGTHGRKEGRLASGGLRVAEVRALLEWKVHGMV